jgi:hypothetical protein
MKTNIETLYFNDLSLNLLCIGNNYCILAAGAGIETVIGLSVKIYPLIRLKTEIFFDPVSIYAQGNIVFPYNGSS